MKFEDRKEKAVTQYGSGFGKEKKRDGWGNLASNGAESLSC